MVYAGQPYMHDPGLGARLSEMTIPALVLWGSSDRIVVPAYGRRFADSIPGSRFEEIAEAGHFSQIEKLDDVLERISRFATFRPLDSSGQIS